MKQLVRGWIAIVLLSLSLRPGTAAEYRVTLAIQADGRCQFTNDVIEGRAVVEARVRQWMDAEAATDAEPAQDAQPATAKQLSDEELARQLREMLEAQAGQPFPGGSLKTEIVDVGKQSVRTVAVLGDTSLPDGIGQVPWHWRAAGVWFESVRLEKDTNGHLQVTFLPFASAAQRIFANQRREWMRSHLKSEFRLVLPGKVIRSAFPKVEDRATWFSMDGDNRESVDAAEQLHSTPVVITSELGGLKFDQPLDSLVLQRARRQPVAGTSDLPITDAGPGFVAEVLSATVTSLQWFPEGEKRRTDPSLLSLQSSGVVLRTRLYAPANRTLQSVTGLRLLKAVDDKGRTAAAKASASENSVVFAGSSQTTAAPLDLHLDLPPPDTQAFEEVSAEAIVLSAGNWLKATFTNLQEKTELDLGPVLPGAKLTLGKLSLRSSQLMIQAEIKGPPQIRQLEFQCRVPGLKFFTPNVSESRFSARGDQSARSLQIQGYGVNVPAGSLKQTLTLQVRYPTELRRERVRFTVRGIDLL
jgi:hypothetical protein